MVAPDCPSTPWLLLEGFPLALFAATALLLGLAWLALRQNPPRPAEAPGTAPETAALRQNRAYKASGAGLLLLGALGGFGPSVFLLLRHGQVWSVNHQAPHTDADAALAVHIGGAILWAVLVAAQLWSGGVPRRVAFHRTLGWAALSALMIGVVVSGGWIWTFLHDFAEGLGSPDAGAGFYTIFLATAAAANGILAVRYARRKDFARHKDFALMALLWTMDPGIHRVWMWSMRTICWDCWAPECTDGQGIALAKLPANLFLVAWALGTARWAGRVNRITCYNAGGQFFLWTAGSFVLVQGTNGTATAALLAGMALILGLVVLRETKQRLF